MTLTEDIPNGREQLLDEVLADYMKDAQEGRAPSRQALLDSHPELASALADFFADQDHVERLAAPLRTIAPPPLAIGATLGDYELLGEIAHGGMGIVYRARQQSLHRIVALKVLQAGPLASPEQWQRFQAEAEAIASLDHPHIVSVYEVGVHDNLPYFSMKLFEGGSLANRLSAPGHRTSAKEAASLLVVLADAVHYAHERGILHRDLKPANVLLDAQGQPHVSDFGLAKRAVAGTGETPVPPAALTVSGAIVGTPSYMAPEQAAGSRVLTTAADVYGLGAILYELLTGRPPFRGEDLFETLRRLREEEPQAPRSLNSAIDRDIETICLKCLQKEPAHRYASARALADDLRRYLAGEPIEARPVGQLERLVRWCRRKPVAATVVLAFAAVIVTAFLVVDWYRRKAETELKAKKEKEVQLAERGQKGLGLIDDFCRRLSEDGWGEDPVMQEKRKRLLEKGLAYYRDFLDDPDAGDPARSELIRASFRIGDLAAALGHPDQAVEALKRARVAAETILQFKPDDVDTRLDLARVINRLGTLDKRAHPPRNEDALKSFRQAHDLLAALHREVPENIEISGELGVVCNNQGNLYYDLRRLEEASAGYRECVDINRDLSQRSADLQYTYGLAVSLQNYALLVYRMGQREEAWRHFDEVGKLSRQVVTAEPNILRYRQQLGRYLYNSGCKQYDEKRYPAALKSLLEGRDVLNRLVEIQPRIPWYREDLERVLRQLGHTYRALGASQFSKAVEAYEAAANANKELSARNPRAAEPVHRRAQCLFDGAVLLAKLNRKDDMLRAYRQARDLGRLLVKSLPNRLEYRNLLGMTLNNLGHEEWLLHHESEGLDALLEAIKHNRFAFARQPRNDLYRRVLYTTYVFLADLHRSAGRHEDQVAALREQRTLQENNPSELVVIAVAFARAGADEEAVRTLEQAVGKGFKDVSRLEKDSALTTLRQRPDVRKLLQELKAKRSATLSPDGVLLPRPK
ncbi:MAG TPA: serine/threonine-protein kinase [Gemmataceae bacterium]|jgi:tetratricopeptide (TPR) repeat protein